LVGNEEWKPREKRSLENSLAKKFLVLTEIVPSNCNTDAIIYKCFETLYQIAGIYTSIINPDENNPRYKTIRPLIDKVCPEYSKNPRCNLDEWTLRSIPSFIDIAHISYPLIDKINNLLTTIKQQYVFLYPLFGNLTKPSELSETDYNCLKQFYADYLDALKAYKREKDFSAPEKHPLYMNAIDDALCSRYPIKYSLYKKMINSCWFSFSQRKKQLFSELDENAIAKIDPLITLLSNEVGSSSTFDVFLSNFRKCRDKQY